MTGEYPSSAPTTVHPSSNQPLPFRSPLGLRNAILAIAGLHVLLNVLATTQSLHMLDLLRQVIDHGISYSLGVDLQQGGHRQLVLGGLQGLVILVAYGLGGLWIYRAACNVRALGAKGIPDSPAWAVGWYFVPFANVVRPFKAMQDIWQASLAPARWDRLSSHPALGAWWASFLTVTFFGAFVLLRQSTGGTVAQIHAQEVMTLWLQPLSFAATTLFAVLVYRISDMQMAEHARQHRTSDALHVVPAMA